MWINPETQHTYANHSEIRAAFPQVSLPVELSDELIASMGLVAIAPPTAPEGQVPIWTGQAWALVPAMTMGQLFVGMSSLIREQELLVSGA